MKAQQKYTAIAKLKIETSLNDYIVITSGTRNYNTEERKVSYGDSIPKRQQPIYPFSFRTQCDIEKGRFYCNRWSANCIESDNLSRAKRHLATAAKINKHMESLRAGLKFDPFSIDIDAILWEIAQVYAKFGVTKAIIANDYDESQLYSLPEALERIRLKYTELLRTEGDAE